jgi:hypothetical protein
MNLVERRFQSIAQEYQLPNALKEYKAKSKVQHRSLATPQSLAIRAREGDRLTYLASDRGMAGDPCCTLPIKLHGEIAAKVVGEITPQKERSDESG